MTNEERRLAREVYKRAGICVQCCKRDAEPGKTICFECSEYHRKWSLRAYRNLKKDKAAYREYLDRKNELVRARYWYRKENGLCVQCGRPRNEDDVSICGRCQEKQLFYRFQNAERLKAIMDAKCVKWYCNRCHRPMAHGEYKVCEDCRRYAREQYYKRRRNKKNKKIV